MFKLTLVTPQKRIVTERDLEEITLPAFAGELNILPGHAPLMTTLEAGVLKYKLVGEAEQKLAISWGYCQVSPQGVNILAEHAVTVDEVNAKAVAEKLKTQEARMATESLDDVEWKKLELEVAKLKAEAELVSGPTRH